jgi:DNA-binding MarR family transcriptional regulator
VDERKDLPVGALVWRLSMRWRAAVDRTIAPLGLTHAQYSVLAPLLGMERAGRRPSQRQLADFTGLEPLYVSKLARTLESAGLVERTGDPKDTRAVRLGLTDRGRSVITEAIRLVRALHEELTAALGGPDDPRTLALAESLRALLDTPSTTTDRTGESP